MQLNADYYIYTLKPTSLLHWNTQPLENTEPLENTDSLENNEPLETLNYLKIENTVIVN